MKIELLLIGFWIVVDIFCWWHRLKTAFTIGGFLGLILVYISHS